MITTETPYKLAEIYRDTWPGIFRQLKNKNDSNSKATKN